MCPNPNKNNNPIDLTPEPDPLDELVEEVELIHIVEEPEEEFVNYYHTIEFPFDYRTYFQTPDLQYKSTIGQLQANSSKYQFTIGIDLLVTPSALLSSNLRKLFAGHIADKVTHIILCWHFEQTDPIVVTSLNTLERKIKLADFLKRIEKYLEKRIKRLWRISGITPFNLITEHSYIF